MPIPEQSIPVVGARYPNRKGGNREFEIKMCQPGEAVSFEPEPRNPADGNAIKVISSRGIQMGYVIADRTWMLHRAWKEKGEPRALFQNAYPDGCWIRVTFDGSEPTLPMMAPPVRMDLRGRIITDSTDPISGFYPDDTPMDE